MTTDAVSQDGFLGQWQVAEYIYNPDGSFAGINRQQRRLERMQDQTLKVTQICDPDLDLQGHAMGAFAGEWVFNLQSEGKVRRYLGPDVLGSGFAWTDGVITGRGLWPRFGYGFSSFSLLATPYRQLTGGKFFRGTRLIANILGIAVAAAPITGAGGENLEMFPVFSGSVWPGDLSSSWQGHCQVVDALGHLLEDHAITRSYTASGWREQEMELEFTPDPGETPVWRVHGNAGGLPVQGTCHRSGWLLEYEFVSGWQRVIEGMELLDPQGGHLVSLRRSYREHILERLEIIRLTAAPGGS